MVGNNWGQVVEDSQSSKGGSHKDTLLCIPLLCGVRRWKRSAGTPAPFLGHSVGGGYHATSPQLRNMLFRVFVGVGNKVYHCPVA